ncbi:MAG: M56 family metallopeptidase [Lachnospiraceae bacterium]
MTTILNSGILILSILLIRKLAWGHISRRLQYALWIVVLLFFITTPFLTIHSDYSAEHLINGITTQITNSSIITTEFSKLLSPTTDPSLVASDTTISSEHIATILRFSVTALLLLAFLSTNIRFSSYCKKNRTYYGQQNGLKIYSMPGIPSPFLFGKGIYLDDSLLSQESLIEHVILHETCHYKHKDNFWVLVRSILLAVFWYNPFLWLAIPFIKRDCELACDEAALLHLDDAARLSYGQTLLMIIKSNNSKQVNLTVATTMSGNLKKLHERISLIATKKKASVLAILLVLCTMLALSFSTFTSKESTKLSQDDMVEYMLERLFTVPYEPLALAYDEILSTALDFYIPTDDSDSNALADSLSANLDTAIAVLCDGYVDESIMYDPSSQFFLSVLIKHMTAHVPDTTITYTVNAVSIERVSDSNYLYKVEATQTPSGDLVLISGNLQVNDEGLIDYMTAGFNTQ